MKEPASREQILAVMADSLEEMGHMVESRLLRFLASGDTVCDVEQTVGMEFATGTTAIRGSIDLSWLGLEWGHVTVSYAHDGQFNFLSIK